MDVVSGKYPAPNVTCLVSDKLLAFEFRIAYEVFGLTSGVTDTGSVARWSSRGHLLQRVPSCLYQARIGFSGDG